MKILKTIAAAATLAALVAAPQAHAQVGFSSFLQYSGDPLFNQSIYATETKVVSHVAPDGAVGANADWESGSKDKWFIEEQRYSGDIIQAGIAQNQPGWIQDGIRIMDWGYKHQSRDGGFAGTGDPFHSTALFVEGSARGILLLKAYNSSQYARVISRFSPKIDAAAHWLTEPSVAEKGQQNNMPYTHRRWILAAALTEAGVINDDQSLLQAAIPYAEDGISRQQSDGVDPEKDGYDVSYQAVGILMAERFYLLTPDRQVAAQTKQVIDRGLQWEASKIDPSGNLQAAGSTRVGVETGRSDEKKTVDRRSLEQALVYGTNITGDQEFRSAAQAFVRGGSRSQIGY